MNKDSLGDRIKGYENVSRHKLVKRMPVMLRLDGRAFHTLTRHMQKPFDQQMMSAMVAAATDTFEQIQGAKAAYIQSDEVTIAFTDYDSIRTGGWFDYNLQKICSIAAATMSLRFAFHMGFESHQCEVFDCRAFNIPADDIVNAFLWRALDWNRNSIQMYASANFSHKELHGKNRAKMHDMLHGIGKNWTTDLTDQAKNGTFLIKTDEGVHERSHVLPTYSSISHATVGLFDYPEVG